MLAAREGSASAIETASGLHFQGIDKHFGGTYALRDVSMSVGRGEIVALLGENGAGKSTLIKMLGGIHRRTAARF